MNAERAAYIQTSKSRFYLIGVWLLDRPEQSDVDVARIFQVPVEIVRLTREAMER